MKKRNIPFFYLASSWVFGAIGLILGIVISPEIFGRFGSIIVLLAVMSEYVLLENEKVKLYSALKGQGAAVAGNTGIPDLSPSKWHKRQEMMSHITIITGTIIWGFGDTFPL